jgi:hypothetical protein
MKFNNDHLLFGCEAPANISHIDGLTAFATTNFTKPELPSLAAFENLDADARGEINAKRLRHLSGGLLVRTPQMIKIVGQAERLIMENQARSSGLGGLIITGESTMGKTTIAKAVVRRVFYKFALAYPDYEREGYIPVVFVDVPPGASGKALVRRFASFLGISVQSRETLEVTMDRVVSILHRARTVLVVVDELHNLKIRTAASGEAVDVLKSLSNRLHATFVYAGIALDDSDLLSGDRGRQITGRFVSAPLRPFTLANASDRGLWHAVIKRFEDELCLMNHRPGELKRLSQYLYRRTGGSIGSLGRLLTGTAAWMIYTGCPPTEERLTKHLLDETVLDIAAEESAGRAGNSPQLNQGKKP